MAILLKSDATIGEVKPRNGRYFKLGELQRFVG